MIEVDQTVMGPKGNCLSASLASLLHLSIEEVPNFNDGPDWIKEVNTWLRPYGLAYFLVGATEEWFSIYGIKGCYHELSGPSPRLEGVDHSCVGLDGKLIFDPHTEARALGVHPKPTTYGVIILLQPWERFDELKELGRETNG